MAGLNYQPLFEGAGQTYDVDPLLLQAIQQNENASGDPNAVGPANKSGERAQGLMQFLPSTAAEQGVDVTDPLSSINGAAKYLGVLRGQTNDNLPQMLAIYGGGNATEYAGKVIDTYHQLQAQQRGPATDTDPNSPTYGQPTTRNLKSTERGPGYGTTAQGNPGQPAANVPTTAAADAPAPGVPTDPNASFTMQSPAPAPVASDEPPKDFLGQLFGKPAAGAVTTQKPTAGTNGATKPEPEPNEQGAPGGDDFLTQLFGKPSAAPAAASAGAATPAPATPAAETPSTPPAPSQRAADAALPTASAAPIPPPMRAPSPANALTTPSGPSWWQRNVAIPFSAMDDPRIQTPQPFLNQPFLQSAGAGLGQGVRDIGTTLNNVGSWADVNVPGVGALDRAIGFTPEQAAATKAQEAAETQAYEKQYPGDYEAMAGRFAGNMLAAPVGGVGRAVGAIMPPVARAVGEVGAALPEVSRYVAPVARFVGNALPYAAEWGTTGGLQNMLTGGGETPEQWGRDLEAGGLGGAVLGSATRGAGAFLGQATTALQQKAQDLGFNLSLGDLRGGLAKAVESFTQYLPGSGNAAYQAANKANVGRILNRNMGLDGDAVNLETMAQAQNQAKDLMDGIQNITINGNTDQTFSDLLSNLHEQAADRGLGGITKEIDNIWNLMARPSNGGTLPGQSVQDLIGRGGSLDNMIRGGSPGEPLLAQQIKNGLLDAASRSTSDPQAVADFNRGRYYWKTIQTVLPLVRKTGDAADTTYTALGNRILGTPANPNFDPMFQRGNNEMSDLANVLHGVLPDLKSSGTGRELTVARMLGMGEAGGLGGLGAGIAHFLTPGNLESYITGALAPAIVGGGVGRAMRLGLPESVNQLMQRGVAPYVGNALLNQNQPPARGQ
jgi:hypothetical protein